MKYWTKMGYFSVYKGGKIDGIAGKKSPREIFDQRQC